MQDPVGELPPANQNGSSDPSCTWFLCSPCRGGGAWCTRVRARSCSWATLPPRAFSPEGRRRYGRSAAAARPPRKHHERRLVSSASRKIVTLSRLCLQSLSKVTLYRMLFFFFFFQSETRGKNFPPTRYSTLIVCTSKGRIYFLTGAKVFSAIDYPRHPSKSFPKWQRTEFPPSPGERPRRSWCFRWSFNVFKRGENRGIIRFPSALGFLPLQVCTGILSVSPGVWMEDSKLPSGASRLPLTRGPAMTRRRVRGVAGMGFRQPPSAPGKRYRKSGRTKKEKQNQMYFFSHVSHELSYRAGTCYCQWTTLVKGFYFFFLVKEERKKKVSRGGWYILRLGPLRLEGLFPNCVPQGKQKDVLLVVDLIMGHYVCVQGAAEL